MQDTLGRSVLDWPTGVTVYKPEKCYNGYTVTVPYRSELMFLIDMKGRVVHVWQAEPSKHWQSCFLELLPSGNWITLNYLTPYIYDIQDPTILLDTRSKFEFEKEVVELDWNGKVVWRYVAPKKNWILHHDMARIKNGNTLLLIEKTIQALHISSKKIAENFFLEITAEGEVVWEWYTSEHYDEFGFDSKAKELIAAEGGDCFHTNTLEVLPGNALAKSDKRFTPGNILSCQRNTNLIYIIDKKTKRVVWKWGNEKGQLVGPHHPTVLHNGNILIYDNGGVAGYPPVFRSFTRLVEINPVTGRVVWTYQHEPYVFKDTSKFFSSSWGSVQRLPNGNTFSLDCHKGRLFEITPQGEIVWEYISPFSWGRGVSVIESSIYRAYRYSYDRVPQANPYFRNTDGHLGVKPVKLPLPEGLGLPSTALP